MTLEIFGFMALAVFLQVLPYVFWGVVILMVLGALMGDA